MKKIFAILFLIFSTSIFSQNIFDKYEDMENVSSLLINSKMFKMLADMNIVNNDSNVAELLVQFKNLNSLTVYSTNDNIISKSIINDVKTYVNDSKLEELMKIKENNQEVKFFIRPGGDDYNVSELLMLVTGNINSVKGKSYNTILLSLFGGIDLRTISNLTKKLDIPGGQALQNVHGVRKK